MLPVPTSVETLVVKVGTSALTAGAGTINPRRTLELVRQIAVIMERGVRVALVTSGAIAAGRELPAAARFGRDIPAKQMLSAIGQPRLMHLYTDLFRLFEIDAAQVLLTRGDFTHRPRYLNARDTLTGLLDHGFVPVINENDAVSTDEIRLGDNDNLSAYVSNLINADLLVMLTDQPGLFSTDPRKDPQAKLIPVVERIDDDLWDKAGGSGTSQGTGGMITKLQAAQLATRSGTTVVIAQGARPGVLLDVLGPEGHSLGTWFEAQVSHIESRKRWMVSEQSQGRITVDNGAARKLREGGASLLPVGMTAVSGTFERGVVVSVVGASGEEVARGLVNYAADDLSRLCRVKSAQIEALLGYTYGDEVIHRDHLVLIDTGAAGLTAS